jgi:hypothetical protein
MFLVGEKKLPQKPAKTPLFIDLLKYFIFIYSTNIYLFLIQSWTFSLNNPYFWKNI